MRSLRLLHVLQFPPGLQHLPAGQSRSLLHVVAPVGFFVGVPVGCLVGTRVVGVVPVGTGVGFLVGGVPVGLMVGTISPKQGFPGFPPLIHT